MKLSLPIAIPLVCAALTAGCGSFVNFTPLNAPARPLHPRSPESVELLMTGTQTPYVEVGTIEAQQQAYSMDGQDAMLAKIRIKAAEVGCDGVLVIGRNDTIGSRPTSERPVLLEGFRAVCVQYKEAPATPPPASASAK